MAYFRPKQLAKQLAQSVLKILLLLGFSIAVSGCGEINKPYKQLSAESRQSNPLVIPTDARGIYLDFPSSELSGDNLDFIDQLISNLGSYNIPVQLNFSSIDGYHVIGQYLNTNKETGFIFDILSSNDDIPLTHEVSLKRKPNDSIISLNKRLAEQTAFLIASEIKPQIMEALEKETFLKNISVKILQITGAPGDGDIALKRNMRNIFKRANINLAERSARADLVISGYIVVRQFNEKQDQVRLEWLFQDEKGRELKTLRQQNLVPKDSLNGRWGDVGYLVAAGVVQQAAKTLDQIIRLRAGLIQQSKLANP